MVSGVLFALIVNRVWLPSILPLRQDNKDSRYKTLLLLFLVVAVLATWTIVSLFLRLVSEVVW